MRGRPPKPAEQRRREGNPGKRPIPEPTRLGYRGAPPAPADLDDDVRAAWDEIVLAWQDTGVLRTADCVALEAFATQIALMRQAEARLRTEDLLVKGSQGQPVRNPLVDVLGQAQDRVMRWCERFGLDPSARTRLGLLAIKGRTLEEELSATLDNE